jgi:hypothetical protein
VLQKDSLSGLMVLELDFIGDVLDLVFKVEDVSGEFSGLRRFMNLLEFVVERELEPDEIYVGLGQKRLSINEFRGVFVEFVSKDGEDSFGGFLGFGSLGHVGLDIENGRWGVENGWEVVKVGEVINVVIK